MKSFNPGDTDQPLHFLHANGYPPACYKPLVELLETEYHVFGMLLRPLWGDARPEEIQDWSPFSTDLLQFLARASTTPHDECLGPLTVRAAKLGGTPVRDGSAEKVIGVGHSIGAIVTLRAALREPGRFKALVLIDPVLFIPRRLILWKIFTSMGLGDRVNPLIAGAKKRRRTFDDLETVFTRFRNRHIFRYMSDEYLRIYIEGILHKVKDEYELVYTPEWEAQIYRTGLHDFDLWRDLPKLEIPTLFIRGAESDTFLENAERLVKKKQPRARAETLPRATHLLPLEYPREVFDIMQSFLKEVL